MDGKIKEEPGSPEDVSCSNRKSKGDERSKSPISRERSGQTSPLQLTTGKNGQESTMAVSKVRRLMHTLVQHAEEMSSTTADRVRSLILALVANTITMEEFHSGLLDVTGFPLRPFVLPYLQTYLPLLQQDLSAQARIKKLSILEYVTTCESAIFERGSSPSFASEVFVKRKLQDRFYEDDIPPIKRPVLVPVHPMSSEPQGQGSDEQWRNIHVMLNCILSMVDKTKQALTLLQQGPRDLVSEEERYTQTVRLTEERIAQIKKKAEDAITDIKRKAQLELERAVAGLKAARPPRNPTIQNMFEI